jgi:hypothetical protein
MKPLSWNLGKNLKLKLERGVGFEMVVAEVTRRAFRIGEVKSKNHPGQKCFIVKLNGSMWVVPFKENKNSIYLYTIYGED